MSNASTGQVRKWLAEMNVGDREARDRLLEYTHQRLSRLAKRMICDFPRLMRWEDAEDVLQNASIRLLKALDESPPTDLPGYFRLASLQLRRELIDLSRRHFGPRGDGANHGSWQSAEGADLPAPEGGSTTFEPSSLAGWTEFHEHASDLEEEPRAVFELLWYHGLTYDEAASVLSVSVATVKRRWLAARLTLQAMLTSESD